MILCDRHASSILRAGWYAVSDNMVMMLQLQQKASSLSKTVQQLQQKLATVTAEVRWRLCVVHSLLQLPPWM